MDPTFDAAVRPNSDFRAAGNSLSPTEKKNCRRRPVRSMMCVETRTPSRLVARSQPNARAQQNELEFVEGLTLLSFKELLEVVDEG